MDIFGVNSLDSLSGLRWRGGSNGHDDHGTILLPSFARKILEDYGRGKLKLKQVPPLIQQKLQESIIATFEDSGFIDKIGFVVQISSLASKGEISGMRRVVVDKIGVLVMDFMEAQGFAATVESLLDDAKSWTDNPSMMQEMREQLNKDIDDLINRVLAPKALAGPRAMHPLLRDNLRKVLYGLSLIHI